MDLAPLEKVGKRDADDAIETAVVSAKKQKVEENVGEITTDTIQIQKKVDTSSQADDCCSKPEPCIEVIVSDVDVHVVSVLEDKGNVLEEDTGAAEKKPAVTSKEGHIAAAFEIDVPNDDADSFLRDETNLYEGARAAISLSKVDPAAPPKKKDKSSKDFDVSSEDAAFLDGDVTAATLSSPPPSTEKPSVFIQEKDDSWIHEFEAHETSNDNVDTAQEEDMTNEELELDDETSSSDYDTPATPAEQTSGGKTLYVGNLSFSVEQEDVEHFFKAAGEVADIHFAMNSDETFKGYGYVEFASAEAAEKALRELNGKELLRRCVRLDFVKERGTVIRYTGCQETESFQKGDNAQGKTVFVRGFSKFDSQDKIRKSLEEHFSFCGEVSRVSVPKDQGGCARGIAYIDFKDRDAFIQALALNGSEFREGILSVIEAKPRVDSHDSARNGRCYGRNGGRHGWHDFGGRSGSSNFGGRSGWQDFGGRSGTRETGGWSGAGVWGESSGRGAKSDSNRRGVLGNSNERGVWGQFNGRCANHDSSGRAASRESSGRGVWGDSIERDASQDSRGRVAWGNSGGRGVWGDSNGRGASFDSSGRRCDREASNGRGVWGNSNGGGSWGNSSGRGTWGDSSDRGVWSNSSGRGVWGDSSGRGFWGDSSGRGAWRGSGERGAWCGSGGRGVWGSFSGRGVWGDSNERGASRGSSGSGAWGNSSGIGALRGSCGSDAWRNSRGRGAWGASSGRGAWGASSGIGVWSDSNGRGILGRFSGSNDVGGSGVCFGGGGRGQETLIDPSIAAPEAGNKTAFNNEGLGEVEDQIK